MADISQVTLSDGNVVNIKDSAGREALASGLAGKVNIAQGVQNEGKILKVASNGLLELTNSGSGTGTVTSIKMNGGVPIEPNSNGIVDLGTVITSHQDLSEITSQLTTLSSDVVYIGQKVDSSVSDLTDDLTAIGNRVSSVETNVTNLGQTKLNVSEKGAAGGIAELDQSGKVPSNQLPSYVDDVLEYSTMQQFPLTGESGKIYIAVDTNSSYRWGGTTYVEISNPVDIMTGATSSSAGTAGLVPAPIAGNQNMFLCGNGTWSTPSIGDNYATKTDTVLDTTLSRGRKANTTAGSGSIAFGESVTASGAYSQAFGSNTQATEYYSHAEGESAKAFGEASHAEGAMTTASGHNSHVEGIGSVAFGSHSHAEGSYTTASGSGSHAEGSSTNASGVYSHAEGSGTEASGVYSHAEGDGTIANAYCMHAQGISNYPSLTTEDIEEWNNDTLYSAYSYVYKTSSSNETKYYMAVESTQGDDPEVETEIWKEINSIGPILDVVGNGGMNEEVRSNAYALDASGNGHFQGDVYVNCESDSSGGSKVASEASVANKADRSDTVLDTTFSRGRKANTTVGTGSIAFGITATASGKYSQAFGYYTTASGDYSNAEGSYTTAAGISSHAEGLGTHASAYAHAGGAYNYSGSGHEGGYTLWSSTKSYVAYDKVYTQSGSGSTITTNYYICKSANTNKNPASNSNYWMDVSSRSKFVETVGNGVSSVQMSNARSLDWNGNEYLAGDLFVNCDHSSENGKKVATAADTVLETTLSRGRLANTTVGNGSFAFGLDATASGSYSHAEGNMAVASGESSHAEGWNTTASGDDSHAEGYNTTASGSDSHAEGLDTIANGAYSHAEGYNTIANYLNMHAQGIMNHPTFMTDAIEEWNNSKQYSQYSYVYKEDSSNNAHYYMSLQSTTGNDPETSTDIWTEVNSVGYVLDVVGNGQINGVPRSNAYALDQFGNGHFQGDVYVNCEADSSGGSIVATADSVQAISDKWKAFGNTTTPIASLDDLPVNGGGRVTLAASISPTGSVVTCVFDKRGVSTRYAVKITTISAGTKDTYVGKMYDGTFDGWMRIATENDINTISFYENLGSFSTQSALDTALTAFNSKTTTQTKACARFTASAAIGGLFSSGTSYFVDLSKGGSDTYSSAIIMPVGGNTTIRALKNTSGWSYSLVAENDQIITYKATLPTGTDFNNVRDIGMYFVSSSSSYTYTNKPNNDTYMLVVFKTSSSSNSPAQMAFGARKVYVRMASSATAWNDWHSIDNYGEGWLPTNTDLDDVLLPGTYGLSTSSTYSHGPASSVGGVMEVFVPSVNEAYAMQRITTSAGTMYVRYRADSSGTVWRSWYKFTGSVVS